MSNDKATITNDDVEALVKLRRYFRPGQLLLLANLIEEICTETGYGGIEIVPEHAQIVLANRKVESIKATKSYR